MINETYNKDIIESEILRFKTTKIKLIIYPIADNNNDINKILNIIKCKTEKHKINKIKYYYGNYNNSEINYESEYFIGFNMCIKEIFAEYSIISNILFIIFDKLYYMQNNSYEELLVYLNNCIKLFFRKIYYLNESLNNKTLYNTLSLPKINNVNIKPDNIKCSNKARAVKERPNHFLEGISYKPKIGKINKSKVDKVIRDNIIRNITNKIIKINSLFGEFYYHEFKNLQNYLTSEYIFIILNCLFILYNNDKNNKTITKEWVNDFDFQYLINNYETLKISKEKYLECNNFLKNNIINKKDINICTKNIKLLYDFIANILKLNKLKYNF